MEILGFEVEARAVGPDAGEFAQWCASVFGVAPAIAVLVASMDEALVAVPGARPVPRTEGEGRMAVIDAPGGVTVELIEPAPPGAHEDQIGAFIASAADLAGPPTDAIAAAVEAVLGQAWERLEALLAEVANNKVLAVHLLLSQRAWADVPGEPAQWQHHAASSLLSGFVGRAADPPPASV